jgi:SAM-dependent methyltransferase
MAQFLFIFLYIAAIFSLFWGLWTIVPIFYGSTWIPTAKDRIRKALEMVGLEPDELLYDLGAGEGRVLFMAEEEFGARAIGIEASFLQAMFTKAKIFLKGKQTQIHVRFENFYQSDFSDADVVFVYLRSNQAIFLQKIIGKKLKVGARVVALSADFPDWKPIAFNDSYLIFIYEMPPQKGGLTAYIAELEKFSENPPPQKCEIIE